MDERDWLIITVLYEQKNVTKAAQALFISQPALTARIRHIERDLGVSMIVRGSRGIHFTPEGEYLAESAGEILAQIRRVRERALNMAGEIGGTLRIAAPDYIAKCKLPSLLGLFKRQYPDVEFNVTNAWSRDVCRLVYNQEVHIGFVRNDYNWQDEKHVLHEEPLCIAAKKEIALSDLPKLARIDYHTDASYKAFLDEWWNGHFTQPPRISMTVAHMDICKAMVANGLGYAILPTTILQDIGPTCQIPLRDKNGQVITRRTTMIYQQETLNLRLVKLFVEFVKTVDYSALG